MATMSDGEGEAEEAARKLAMMVAMAAKAKAAGVAASLTADATRAAEEPTLVEQHATRTLPGILLVIGM